MNKKQVEIWKDIPGYEGVYQISNLGKVKSLPRKWDNGRTSGCIMKIGKDTGGYASIKLCLQGQQKTISVHRLVGQAFMNLNTFNTKIKSYHGLCVLHKNDIRDDNRLENLFLGTQKENMIDCAQKGRCPSSGKLGKLNKLSKKIKQIDIKTGIIIKIWECMSEITRSIGVNTGHICEVCKGNRPTAGGYKWEYSLY